LSLFLETVLILMKRYIAFSVLLSFLPMLISREIFYKKLP
jgi:hypothetical protein